MDREKNLAAWHEGSHFATKNRDGSPRVYYHGSNQKLNIIEPNRRDPGAWFTTNLQGAANYARGEDAHVHEVYLKSKNPMVVPFNYDESGNLHAFHNDKKLPFSDNVSIVKHAQKLGYDGVHFPNGNFSEDDNTFVVFHPHQIKSATGNNGNFDPNDPDITKGDGGEVDGITAYHGSPHEFEQFDTSKIGTGEGAQAYGHGLYFAEAEPVAKGYRDSLLGRGAIISGKADNLPDRWQMAIYEAMKKPAGEIRDYAISELRKKIPSEYADQVNNILSNKGHMYEVNINAHPDHFLDWDKPLHQQTDYVKEALAKSHPEAMTKVANNVFQMKDGKGRDRWFTAFDDTIVGRPDGFVSKSDADYALKVLNEKPPVNAGDWYQKLGSSEHQSKLMNQAGIKGIKYLDASSRNVSPAFDPSYLERQIKKNREEHKNAISDQHRQELDEDHQTLLQRLEDAKKEKHLSRNYVVFDHNDVDIKRRYEQGGAVDQYPLAEDAQDHFKEMPPQEFLDQARPLKGTAEDKKIIQEFKKDIKKGKKLDPLALYKSGKENGRHRATAAKELGIRKVPVHDYRKRDGGAIVKRALMVISKKA